MEVGGFGAQCLTLGPGWRTTDGATEPSCSDRGQQVETPGPECECWQFMSGAGRRSAQLGDSDSWAARGRGREPGHRGGSGCVGLALEEEAQDGRGRGRERGGVPLVHPPGWGRSEVRGPGRPVKLGSCVLVDVRREKGVSAPSPASPIPSCRPQPNPEAFGPLQQLC